MRNILLLLTIMIFGGFLVSTQAQANGDVPPPEIAEGDLGPIEECPETAESDFGPIEECPEMAESDFSHIEECPEMAERDCCGCMGERPGRMGRGNRWERGWYEHPWNMWRHLDSSVLDYDALQFLGGVRTIAILPFGDMTSPTGLGDSKLKEFGGPRRVVDNLASIFMSRGYLVIPPADVEVVLKQYLQTTGGLPKLSAEAQNNALWFNVMPERSMSYFVEKVDGLAAHNPNTISQSYYLTSEDIMLLGEILGADCIIRGYVNEFALDKVVSHDWRTFVPPFLGLINPDRRATVEVASYIYNTYNGQMVWNSTESIQRRQSWPVFNSERDLIHKVENQIAFDTTDRILPDWYKFIMAHPRWIPYEMWEDFYGDKDMYVHRPDWLNPFRRGWHSEYQRSTWNFHNPSVAAEEPYQFKYRNLSHAYGRYRDWQAPRDY